MGITKVLAQTLTLPGGSSFSGPAGFKFNTLGEIISDTYTLILTISGLAILIMLIMGGFGFLTSAGDAKQMEKARNQITYAIVGFIVLFAAFWVVQIAGIIFGVDEIKSVFGPH